jgi:hypothetical protein
MPLPVAHCRHRISPVNPNSWRLPGQTNGDAAVVSIAERSVRMRAAFCILLLCPLLHGTPCPTKEAKDEATLIRIEETWARALEAQDVDALSCILANEFEDANPVGSLSGRSKILNEVRTKPGSHHELSEIHARIYGEIGYVRGLATALTADRRPKIMVRFTDLYVYREGRWQCVAGHESEVPLERP